MPTYQYSCTECGHFFEVQQSFSEDSLTVCPNCEGRLRKVFNAVGVVFKGSGFYRTDSRDQKSSAGASSSGGSGTGSGSGPTSGGSGSSEGSSGSSSSSSSTGSSGSTGSSSSSSGSSAASAAS